MGRLAGFQYRQVAQKLRKPGFRFERQGPGSHEVWRNASTRRTTTLPHHPGTLPEGTLRAVLREADIPPDDFLQT